MRSSTSDALDRMMRSRQPYGGERPPRLRAASERKLRVIALVRLSEYKNSKQSRPNYDDLTPWNPRETSWVPNTSRAEEKRPPSRQ